MADEERRWVVDSIEEGVAAAAREGGVLRVERRDEGAGSIVRIEVDRSATDESRHRAREQVGRLSLTDPGGDIVL